MDTDSMDIVEALASAPEERLLCLAARLRLGEAERRRLHALLAEEIDWERVVTLAASNKVLPLVHATLRTEAAVPGAARDELRNRSEAIARWNLFLTTELVRVVRTCRTAGVPLVPLKGPALAQMLYGNLALRQFSDLDVLVPRTAYARALDAVTAMGYRLVRPAAAVSRPESEALMRFFGDYTYTLVNPDTGVTLELHWGLSPRDRFISLTEADFWERLEPLTLAGETMPVLSGSELFIYLSVHGAKDSWKRLSWLCDLATFLHRHETMDWAGTLAQARRGGSLRMALLGVFLAHGLLDAPIPEPFLAPLHEEIPKLRRLIRRVRLFHPDPTALGWADVRFHMGVRRGLPAKTRALLDYTVVPRFSTFEETPLPPKLFPLYFLLRPAELCSRRLLRRPSGDDTAPLPKI